MTLLIFRVNVIITMKHIQEENILKTFALIGFIVVIAVLMWGAVQLVQGVPNAVSFVATAFQGAQITTTTPITLSPRENLVLTGDAATLSWNTQEVAGTYKIAYQCAKNITLSASVNGNTLSVPCGTDTIIGRQGTDAIALTFISEERRFVEMPVTLTFIPENELLETESETFTFTVFNKNISILDGIEIEENVTEDTADNTPTPSTPIVTSVIPVSDPNGFINLDATYLGVGTIESNTFISSTQLETSERGAIRFEVKNIGTKTSDDWTFDITLPTDPVVTFTSETQEALKPNERSVLTLGFDDVSEPGVYTVRVSVITEDDIVGSNNTFEIPVLVVE